jgi:predicted 2-oxoglutarate/Fe(II)-dependent dioxygenase YbiX
LDRQDPEYTWVYQRIVDALTASNKKNWGYDLPTAWTAERVEHIQFAEYHHSTKGFYTWHVDRGAPAAASSRRKLSVTVQLTDPGAYDGGTLQIRPKCLNTAGGAGEGRETNADGGYSDAEVPSAGQGGAVVFQSCLLHRVDPVTRGARHSLVLWFQANSDDFWSPPMDDTAEHLLLAAADAAKRGRAGAGGGGGGGAGDGTAALSLAVEHYKRYLHLRHPTGQPLSGVSASAAASDADRGIRIEAAKLLGKLGRSGEADEIMAAAADHDDGDDGDGDDGDGDEEADGGGAELGAERARGGASGRGRGQGASAGGSAGGRGSCAGSTGQGQAAAQGWHPAHTPPPPPPRRRSAAVAAAREQVRGAPTAPQQAAP